MATAPNPCDASFFAQVFAGNAVVCNKTFQNYETKSAQDSIQSVVDNANTNYGSGSAVANVAETTAAQQEAQVTADTANVIEAVANSKVGQIFTTCDSGDAGLAVPGLPCISWKYLLYGAAALVALYVLALISSLVPRPR